MPLTSGSGTRWTKRRGIMALIGVLLPLLIGSGPAAAADPQHKTNDGPWFQLTCGPGPILRDDPVFWPGKRAATHEHLFFGGSAVSGTATYQQVAAGSTTCTDPADTGAYWVDTLYDSAGRRIMPKRIRVYYYANANDPKRELHAFPPDFRMAAGGPTTGMPAPGVIEWLCRKRANQSAGYPLLANDPPRCRPDEFLSVSIRFPDCWDGVQIDSPDHRSHVAYADAQRRCPPSHPVKLPKLRYSVTYEDWSFTGGDFTVGGARHEPWAMPWNHMRAVFWNTWRQDALDRYVEECLKRGRTVRHATCFPR